MLGRRSTAESASSSVSVAEPWNSFRNPAEPASGNPVMTSSRRTSHPDPGTSGSWLEVSFGVGSEGTSGSRVGTVASSATSWHARSPASRRCQKGRRKLKFWTGFDWVRPGSQPT